MSLTDQMKKGPFCLDGGMGTLLQAKGLKAGEAPEKWNLTHPDIIKAIHLDYFRAGSRMVMANTFGVHPLRYDRDTCGRMIRTALDAAKAARDACGGDEERFVALDIGPCGKLLKPLGDLDFEEAVGYFAYLTRLGEKYGADAVMIETMNDGYETKAALLAAKESTSLPVLVSNTYGVDGRLMTGGTPESLVPMLEGLGADAVGVNCSLGPDALKPIVLRYLAAASVPVLMKPNAGLPHTVNGRTEYPVGPEDFAKEVAALVPEGLRIVGGCCGTAPAHIRSLCEELSGLKPPPLTKKRRTAVTSRGRAVYLDDGPAVIGERINPTGKKRLRQALSEGDTAYVLNLAIEQEESGADMLDVNAGAPGVAESEALPSLITALQSVTDLPLQIDTADAAAMEKALRVYNGKAMINSVNGRADVMERVFPLAKKYGGVLVALTLDENGIPVTPEGRLAVAENILAEAQKYGVSKQDIVFDPLTLTVSADPGAADTTLKALRLIREKTGCLTVLGVSNVSYGLPARDVVNSVFLTMALREGLSAAIMNPSESRMADAVAAYRALTGKDPRFGAFIRRYAAAAGPDKENPATPSGQSAPAGSLKRAIIKGLAAEAEKLAAAALKEGRDGMSLIRDEMIPALDEVGLGYENKELYLPQLLMSAEAAQAAFGPIRDSQSALSGTARCGVVLATVRGDVHDIGKNIVKLLLENYGFRVTDLGKDVPPETVLEAVIRLRAPVLGLSALMTTTVPAMEATIALIKREAPFCRVIVGGAVLTEDWARRIGADAYAKDAMATVRLAEKFENAAKEGNCP